MTCQHRSWVAVRGNARCIDCGHTWKVPSPRQVLASAEGMKWHPGTGHEMVEQGQSGSAPVIDIFTRQRRADLIA